jgi:hypothetical protein
MYKELEMHSELEEVHKEEKKMDKELEMHRRRRRRRRSWRCIRRRR